MNTTSVNRYIGKRLFELRTAHGLSAEALAHTIGVTESHIKAIEAGHRRLPIAHMFRIAKTLNTPPEYFHEGMEDVVSLEILIQYNEYTQTLYVKHKEKLH